MFENLKILLKDGWYPLTQKGSHIKMIQPTKSWIIVFPDHGSQELGKGLERKILKDAGIKLWFKILYYENNKEKNWNDS